MFFKKKALPLQCNKTNEGTRKGTGERIKRLRITKTNNRILKGPLRRAPQKTITKLEIKIQ